MLQFLCRFAFLSTGQTLRSFVDRVSDLNIHVEKAEKTFVYTFRRHLKTWLFTKSFPDIIIWYWLHLDFYLRLVCSNFETVLPFKAYNMNIWHDVIYDVWYMSQVMSTARVYRRLPRHLDEYVVMLFRVDQFPNSLSLRVHFGDGEVPYTVRWMSGVITDVITTN